MPRVHLCLVPAQRRKCRNLLAWQTTERTFSLDTYADITAELRHRLPAIEPPIRYIIAPPFTSYLAITIPGSLGVLCMGRPTPR